MKRLIQKFSKVKISPVTGKEVEDEVEANWYDVGKKVKGKAGMAPITFGGPLTTPIAVEKCLEKCKKNQTPAVLMKTVQDIDRDRIMGKRLAMNITQKKGKSQKKKWPSFPVSTRITKTPSSGGSKFNPFMDDKEETLEQRAFNQTELSDLRRDFAQNGAKDAEYMCRLWEKGADTIMLSDQEMKRIRNIVENPAVAEALEHVIETARGDTHPLLDWITAAWRVAYPNLDLTQFETAGQWQTYTQAIRQARKLGILYFIYNEVPTPQAAPLIPQFKRILLKGAPQNMKMSLAGPLQNCQTVADAIEFFKSFRELDTEKVVSFNIRKRRFPKFRPFGNRNRMSFTRGSGQPPWRMLIGRKKRPFPKNRNNWNPNRRPFKPSGYNIRPRTFLGRRPGSHTPGTTRRFPNIRKRFTKPQRR